MNLSMDILRLLTVRAIRGRTWAGDRVFDSPATPADIRMSAEQQPFVAVFVDEADASFVEGDLIGHPSLHPPGDAVVVIEVGVASAQPFDEDGQPIDDAAPRPAESYVTQLNSTDEGLEMQIGFITRQCIDALSSTAESNPWAELWRQMTGSSLKNIMVRRGGPQVEGKSTRPRYASRVTMIKTGVLSDPPRGSDLSEFPFWQTFLDASADDPELGGLSALIRAHITQPTGVQPEWRLAQKHLNTDRVVARALNIAPVEGHDATETTEHPVNPINEIRFTRIPLNGE